MLNVLMIYLFNIHARYPRIKIYQIIVKNCCFFEISQEILYWGGGGGEIFGTWVIFVRAFFSIDLRINQIHVDV